MTLTATHSGVRGRPGVELTDDVIRRSVGGLLEVMRRRGLPLTVAVARDERVGGEALAEEVIEVARREGPDVVDLGVVSTPAAKLTARSRRLGGAVIVTGSHLDPALNGLKLVAGPTFAPVDVRRLPEAPARPRHRPRGRLRHDGEASVEHVSAVCASVDADRIRASGMAVEARGGAGPGAALLVEALGCRRPGVSPDVILRLDADGDRLQLIDERGVELDAELVLPLALLARDAKAVVKGADTSRIVEVVAAVRGATVAVVPPGEIHLVEAVAASAGDLAGEGNGGVVVPAVGLARDGLAAGATVLSLLARRQKSLSGLAAELPRYALRRSTVPCADSDEARVALATLAGRMGSELGDPHDGVRVEPAEQTWGLARLSATEPVIRVTAEAPSEAEADALHTELRDALSG